MRECIACVNDAYILADNKSMCISPIVNCTSAIKSNGVNLCTSCILGYHVSLN